MRDRTRDRIRHKKLEKKKKRDCMGYFEKMLDAASGWILVLMVGISAGLFAGKKTIMVLSFPVPPPPVSPPPPLPSPPPPPPSPPPPPGVIDMAAVWMSDLKEGVCPGDFYYDRASCCWLSDQTEPGIDHCHLWNNWSEHLNIGTPAGRYALDYVIYVVFAVVMAGLAGLFVVELAPYAAGSGIPEVKTILSGFIIRGYLGAWTLMVKAVGMVLAVGAGLSLGKEGPLVHVASCCGNLFTRCVCVCLSVCEKQEVCG